MASRGDLANLQTPIAQEMLSSAIPARMAFNGADGSPRVVPIWFHWDGGALIISTGADSPKMKAIECNPRLAVTIDTERAPYHVLSIRGTATFTREPTPTAEYRLAAVRYLGEERGAAWIKLLGGMPMARIVLKPEWADVFDTGPMMEAAAQL